MWSNIEVPAPEVVLGRAAGCLEAVFEEGNPSDPRIFYCCYAGTHASIVAGWCHLGRQLDSVRTILELPYFDRRLTEEIGFPAFLGRDHLGGYVFALGTGHGGKEVGAHLASEVRLRFPRGRALFFDVRATLDVQSRIGGFLSRRAGIVKPGRYLVARALYRRLGLIRTVVEASLDLERKWRDNEGQSDGEVVWLDAEHLVGRRSQARTPGNSC